MERPRALEVIVAKSLIATKKQPLAAAVAIPHCPGPHLVTSLLCGSSYCRIYYLYKFSLFFPLNLN